MAGGGDGRGPAENRAGRRAAEAGPGIPEPAWRRAAHPRSAQRVPLTRDAIVDAALRVLDREGLDRLSMRLVARELGTGAGSLYWHVRNKGELLQLIAERIAAEMVLPPPDPARWQEQLQDVGRQLRAAAHRHRDGARITLGRVPFGPAVAQFSEWLFELLTPLGIPDRVIAYFGDVASLFVGAYAFEETLGIASPTGEDVPPERILEMFRAYALSLPPERFPHLRRAVGDLFDSDVDARFAFGMDLLLRGIASYARPPAQAPHGTGAGGGSPPP